MDPISAAGIGLSVTSLVLQVFAGCIKGYELLMDAAGMPAKYHHLRTSLRLEQSRLLNWGEKVGLLEELLEHPSQTLQLNHNLILDVLFEVQATFRSCVKIASKYNDLVPERSVTSNGASHPQKSFLRRTLNYWDKPGHVAARLQWAMIKQDSFERAIVQLVMYNDKMESFLHHSAIHELHSMQQKSNLLLLQLSEQVGELKDLAAALRVVRGSAVRASTLSRSSTLVADAEEGEPELLSALASFKLQNLAIPEEIDKLPPPLESSKLNLSSVQPLEDRSVIRMPGKTVWIEWKTPAKDFPTTSIDKIINGRLARLASLLSSPKKPLAFRSPDCIGYVREEVDDDVRYGLVYEVPTTTTSVSETMAVVSLREIFSMKPCPSLTQRMALALKLIESIMYLHAVNWLHKGFRSDSVVFYQTTTSGSGTGKSQNGNDLIAEPIVSGFDFSRPDIPDETTIKSLSRAEHDYYRHPDLLAHHSNVRSRKSYDIYSLGVVLVEIALWTPIEKITESATGKKLGRSQIPLVRQTLLAGSFGQYENIVSAVASSAGDVYAAVTRRCLEGGRALGIGDDSNDDDNDGAAVFDESDPVVGGKIQLIFYEEVYSKLQSNRL